MIKRSASRLLWFGRTRFEQMSRLDLHSSTVHTARHNLSRKPLKVIVSKPDLPIDTLRNSYSDYDELIDLQSVDQSSNIQNPNTSNNDAKRNVYLPKIEQLKDNKKFVAQVVAARNKKFRKRKGLLLLEGARLINDAINAGLRLNTLYFSSLDKLELVHDLQTLETAGVRFYQLKAKDIRLFSELKSCPETMAVFERPCTEEMDNGESDRASDKRLEHIPSSPLSMYLIADNIRDPGNLGTLIRAAAGCGVRRMFCSKGCVDVWESKVIRSSAGSVFRMPIEIEQSWTMMEEYLSKKHDFFGLYLADASAASSSHSPAISTSYTNVKFANSLHGACVLIVSGERGNSSEANQFVNKFGGKNVTIQMHNNVESLNSSVAASIILYEMRRQLLVRTEDCNLID